MFNTLESFPIRPVKYYSLNRTAMTLVELLVVIGIMGIILGLLLPAIQKVRVAAAGMECSHNLRQIGLALHQYHDVYSVFPPGVRGNDPLEPFPFLSWHARLLPFLEKNNLWNKIKQSFQISRNPFRNPPHSIRAEVVNSFVCPLDSRTSTSQVIPDGREFAFTDYLGVEGTSYIKKDGVLFLNSRVSILLLLDGTSNTIFVGERPPSDLRFGWWYSGQGQRRTGSADMILGVRELNISGPQFSNCSPGPYRFTSGNQDNPCDQFHFWSLHPGGAYFLFADGSVRFLSYHSNPILPALATINGGEIVDFQ